MHIVAYNSVLSDALVGDHIIQFHEVVYVEKMLAKHLVAAATKASTMLGHFLQAIATIAPVFMSQAATLRVRSLQKQACPAETGAGPVEHK